MKNKNIRVTRTQLEDQGKEADLLGTTHEERMGMVWQLTINAWAFKGETIDQQRLQRHIERVHRRAV